MKAALDAFLILGVVASVGLVAVFLLRAAVSRIRDDGFFNCALRSVVGVFEAFVVLVLAVYLFDIVARIFNLN